MSAFGQIDPVLTSPESLEITFRQAMRNLAGGVAIITVGQGEERTGMTVTSFSALSTEPASVLVCVNKSSSSYPVLLKERQFGASILGAHQEELAARFAGRHGLSGADRYKGGAWQCNETGVTLLADALAAFDCEVEELIERHSHVIVIGRVRSVRTTYGTSALLYWRGAFGQIS
eukprot:gene10630-10701_t